jgi:glycosyltransferase involved in cell wall biosynthesis
MRILFVADGRSPTALNWLRHWIETGHEVHLVSTFPCDPLPELASFHVLPVAFGGMAGGQVGKTGNATRQPGPLGRLRGPLRTLRYFLGPLGLPSHQKHYHALVTKIQPDLVHALRIPFEGMLAAVAPPGIPLLVSIWGNDLTLHAHGSFLMAAQTRHVLRRAEGLLADTARDIRLGQEWGFAPDKPTLVVPGGGGIRLDEIEADSRSDVLPEELPDAPVVVNPRGQRPGSLRQDVFFRAIPLVLEKVPQVIFVCPSLAGDVASERWVDRLEIRSNTRLWPRLDHAQLRALFKRAQVFVSPSVHDGTPNSLLEAMACGCFPVVGDIESMHEWIRPGVNGLLVDATSPRSMADGIVAALEAPALRAAAKNENTHVIAERAEYGRCMATAEVFYRKVLERKGSLSQNGVASRRSP